MTDLSLPPQVAEFMRAVGETRRTVFWSLDRDRAVWEFDGDGAPPADGSDWFFVVNFPRTGSTAAAKVLSGHPEMYCGNEQNVLPLLMTLLHSRLLMAPDLWESVRFTKQIPVTEVGMRRLMDAWRANVSDRRLFGDKGDMYHHRFGPACKAVFPGCRFVLTVRAPLDALSSYAAQPWAVYLYLEGDRAGFFRALREQARLMLARNAEWRGKAAVVEFERLTSRDAFVAVFSDVFVHLGADPTVYDWDAGWALCRHAEVVGRWREDRQILGFLDWLEQEDPQLRAVLESGAYYAE